MDVFDRCASYYDLFYRDKNYAAEVMSAFGASLRVAVKTLADGLGRMLPVQRVCTV